MGKGQGKQKVVPRSNPQWDALPYRIGCPVWASRDWSNSIYPPGTPADAILSWYSRCFPTVEGNSTFYAVAAAETFEKWRDAVPNSFQFSFKFPREISHYKKLVGCDELMRVWLSRLKILKEAGKLGPTFLQLAPSFSFAQFPQLTQFLKQLPRDWSWAVELRHEDWFDAAECEEQLDTLLAELKIDRVHLDSRPLNSQDASDATEVISQSRKPKSPFRTTVTAGKPMVRLIGRNQLDQIVGYWEQWALQIAKWIRDGHQPWVFTHAPDDQFAPHLARHLHDLIRIEIPEMPELPKVDEVIAESESGPTGQMRLF